MPKVLIVDDELSVRESLKMVFKDEYSLLFAINGEEALNVAQESSPDVILLDIIMPVLDGLTVLEKVKEFNPSIKVIMLTATKTVKTAVRAMRLGAYDYITKPFDVEELSIIVKKALETQKLEEEVKYLRTEVEKKYEFSNIIGKSKEMRDVYSRIAQIADTKSTVLITGESGTGKELVAKAIHYNSSRRDKPFIAINCAAIPETLIEAELFGHEKGAFTDAQARRQGQFELADKGTLFLDEIGDLSLATQAKILRVLQEREFTRIGGVKPLMVDIRLIAATNKNLDEAMSKGVFREDLYYRINVVPVHLPPLRERREDIPLLVNHILAKKAEEEGKKLRGMSKEAMDILATYTWPGNVRELENVIERVTTLCSNDIITAEDLPANIRGLSEITPMKERVLKGNLTLRKAIREFERDIILNALERTNYVQTQAANLLGISRRMLKYKIDYLGIKIIQKD